MINFNRNVQIRAINMLAAIISLLMVTKMLYQIKYINHENWDVNCTVRCVRNRGLSVVIL